MAVQAHVSSSLYTSIRAVSAVNSNQTRVVVAQIPLSTSSIAGSSIRGTPLLVWKTSSRPRNTQCKAKLGSIRSEQSSKGGGGSGLDLWLGRFAMTGFAAAIVVEVTTGKGLLENFGLTSPLPTVALGVTAVVGVLTAIFIFQSASKD